MSTTVAFCSFRLGGGDGVSVVARTWMDVMSRWGWDVRTVTGSAAGHDPYPHTTVEGLGIDDEAPASDIVDLLAAALHDVDLVIVENLLTIPLNLRASAALAEVLQGRPALLHHHDPPWHRERFAHIDALPTDDPAWRHVAITHLLRDELAERGIESTTIHNAFAAPNVTDAAELATLRGHVRSAVGLDATTIVVAHPVRAIERKNIPAAIELAESLGATYWLLGAVEEGYGPELDRLMDDARCPVLHRGWMDIDGIYAAADHVAFPSTWEGFGNPPIEASLRRRGVSVGAYPVADELRALGFEWFDPTDIDGIRRSIDQPDDPAVQSMMNRNEAVARQHFSVEGLDRSLRSLVDEAGWW